MATICHALLHENSYKTLSASWTYLKQNEGLKAEVSNAKNRRSEVIDKIKCDTEIIATGKLGWKRNSAFSC